MDFVSDKDKIIDFFCMSREAFLESYNYLTEDDYTITAKAIGYKVKFNDYENADYTTIEGKYLDHMVRAAMMFEYINE